FALGLIFLGSSSVNVHYLTRPYDIEVLDSGYKFLWDGNPRPVNFDYEEYERKKNAHSVAPSRGK
ncbi:MAG TPA: hypothetical protein VIU13_05730, partial [Chryseolinea sp.]